jgi:hypothetical protein
MTTSRPDQRNMFPLLRSTPTALKAALTAAKLGSPKEIQRRRLVCRWFV